MIQAKTLEKRKNYRSLKNLRDTPTINSFRDKNVEKKAREIENITLLPIADFFEAAEAKFHANFVHDIKASQIHFVEEKDKTIDLDQVNAVFFFFQVKNYPGAPQFLIGRFQCVSLSVSRSCVSV